MTATGRNPWVTLFRWISIGLIAILAMQIVFLLWQSISGRADSLSNIQTEADRVGAIEQLEQLENFTEVIQRTLFSWNRKPELTSEIDSTEREGVFAAKWRLTGLVNTPDSTYAVFSEVDGARQLRLERGMSLDNWSVDQIDTEQVTLANGEETVVLRLSLTDTPQLETERRESQHMDALEEANPSNSEEDTK